MKVGYCRVSTRDQNLNLQLDALKKAGCSKIFSEKISGTTRERPELIKALDFCREGDVFTVWKLDRLGRSTKDLIDLISEMEKRKIEFQSLTESLDTSTSTGKLLFNLISCLAQFQADLIKERTLAGLEAAKNRGRVGGRPRSISPELLKRIKKMHDAGMTVKELSNQLKISTATIYRYLAGTRESEP